MAKIQSRPREEDTVLESLRAILSDHTDGMIGPVGTKIPTDTIEDMLVAVDLTIGTAVSSCRTLSLANQILAHDITVLAMKYDTVAALLESVLDVGYDSALDDATGDLMDNLIASGAAEASVDGALAFDPRVLMSRSDLKPILREAIQTWIGKKI
jgi:hypothetical protein